MARQEEIYQVTFYEYLQVVERVVATSKADAIRRVKEGDGQRESEMVDEERWPFGHKAVVEEA
ncbi:hypothetical protein [Streptomyces mirabilis]|uniref:hypothetical protein n=1 Tax=Streptomyces mirabilis TaxID=68239 RepID=UPI003699A550